jgi:hypothetical protein
MTNYELYIDTLKSLASSQGCYARALDDFNKMSDAEKERLEKELNQLHQMKDKTEMCMFLEDGLSSEDDESEKKYGKDVLAWTSYDINGDTYEYYLLDDGDYYNIHVISPDYRDDEMNTLRLQEPKDVGNLETLKSKAYMLSRIFEFALWHECYGDNDKCYDFNIDYEETEL